MGTESRMLVWRVGGGGDRAVVSVGRKALR